MRYNRRRYSGNRSVIPYGVRRMFTTKNIILAGIGFAAYHFRDKVKEVLTKLKG